MVFVEKPDIRIERILENMPQGFIVLRASNQTKTRKYTPCVGVNDKYRAVKDIEQDIVGGFGADAMHGEETVAQFIRGEFRNFSRSTLPYQPLAHRAQAPGFDVEISGGLEPTGESARMDLDDRLRRQRPVPPEVFGGPFGVSPGGILRQHRADHDFKRGVARPPVLLSVGGEKLIVHLGNTGTCLHRIRYSAVINSSGGLTWRNAL